MIKDVITSLETERSGKLMILLRCWTEAACKYEEKGPHEYTTLYNFFESDS